MRWFVECGRKRDKKQEDIVTYESSVGVSRSHEYVFVSTVYTIIKTMF